MLSFSKLSIFYIAHQRSRFRFVCSVYVQKAAKHQNHNFIIMIISNNEHVVAGMPFVTLLSYPLHQFQATIFHLLLAFWNIYPGADVYTVHNCAATFEPSSISVLDGEMTVVESGTLMNLHLTQQQLDDVQTCTTPCKCMYSPE